MAIDTRTQLRAAETILDRGVRFRLSAPIFLRLIGADRLSIRAPRAGTILEFSRVVIAYKLNDKQKLKDFKALEQEIDPICHCIAISILNNKRGIAKRSKRLARRLKWRYKASDLVRVFVVLAEMNSAADFTTITKYYSQTAMTMMRPNLGQNGKGR